MDAPARTFTVDLDGEKAEAAYLTLRQIGTLYRAAMERRRAELTEALKAAPLPPEQIVSEFAHAAKSKPATMSAVLAYTDTPDGMIEAMQMVAPALVDRLTLAKANYIVAKSLGLDVDAKPEPEADAEPQRPEGTYGGGAVPADPQKPATGQTYSSSGV